MERSKFPTFYRANVTRIYRFLYFRVGGKKEVAEDLTQDVFLKALAAFESYDPAISETSWIITIARNHLINYLEKQKPNVNLEEIQETALDRVDMFDKISINHDEKRLLEAIKELPDDDALIVRMKYLEGWPYDEIAKKVGKNTGALRVQAHRALKNLKKILKQK